MPRLNARDLSNNSPSSLTPTTDQPRDIKIFDTANGETGQPFFARDFVAAHTFIIALNPNTGDTLLLETRTDDAGAWETEQTVTTNISYEFTASEQFRVRRSVNGAVGVARAWLSTRRK